MAGQLAHSFRSVAEVWLSDLYKIHQRMSQTGYAKGYGAAYVMNLRQFVSPTSFDVNRQALTQLLVQSHSDHPDTLELIYSITLDQWLLADYYAIAWNDAQEEVLNSVAQVWQQQIRLPWVVRPVCADGELWLSKNGQVAAYVEAELQRLSVEIYHCGNGVDSLLCQRLENLSHILSAADRAFKAAAARLMNFDMEQEVAGLIQNEALAEMT